MRISRVFVDTELVVGEEIALDKPRGHYLKHVLRLKSGAALLLFNGREAIDYHATLVFDGQKMTTRIESAIPLNTESRLGSEIIQGLGRADHMDWMIQKTTELGASKISLFNAARTQSPLKPAQLEKKLTHWRRVAISACEQSGRAIVPQVDFHATLSQAMEASVIKDKLLLDFGGADLTSVLHSSCTAVSILLGSEGGLSQAEIQLAKTAGFTAVKLGPRVLRTETAATAALAIVQATLGDLS